jgi:2-methylisocitrate lyase-like PEP mutase family enzyme
MSQAEINARFKRRVQERAALLVPGAANALAARVIADCGFEALYLSGAGVTNTFLGLPDLGFLSLPELVQHTEAIRDVVDLPIIVDGETGFGNAVNVHHTVRRLERAGASVLQLEDQAMPKRCGHFSGKEVVAAGEMVGKIKAAVDARADGSFLVMARTDARAVEGFAAAVDRAGRYAEAGADILFVEAPESIEEIEHLPEQVPAPLMMNVVIGGRTPVMPLEQLRGMGYALVLYANAALQGAVHGMQVALRQLKEAGRLDEGGPVASFAERQRLVRKKRFDELEHRYAGDG